MEGAARGWAAETPGKADAPLLVVSFSDAGAFADEFLYWDAISDGAVHYVWPYLPGRPPRDAEPFPESIQDFVPVRPTATYICVFNFASFKKN